MRGLMSVVLGIGLLASVSMAFGDQTIAAKGKVTGEWGMFLNQIPGDVKGTSVWGDDNKITVTVSGMDPTSNVSGSVVFLMNAANTSKIDSYGATWKIAGDMVKLYFGSDGLKLLGSPMAMLDYSLKLNGSISAIATDTTNVVINYTPTTNTNYYRAIVYKAPTVTPEITLKPATGLNVYAGADFTAKTTISNAQTTTTNSGSDLGFYAKLEVLDTLVPFTTLRVMFKQWSDQASAMGINFYLLESFSGKIIPELNLSLEAKGGFNLKDSKTMPIDVALSAGYKLMGGTFIPGIAFGIKDGTKGDWDAYSAGQATFGAMAMKLDINFELDPLANLVVKPYIGIPLSTANANSYYSGIKLGLACSYFIQ